MTVLLIDLDCLVLLIDLFFLILVKSVYFEAEQMNYCKKERVQIDSFLINDIFFTQLVVVDGVRYLEMAFALLDHDVLPKVIGLLSFSESEIEHVDNERE